MKAPEADWYIGHSLGASYALDLHADPQSKFILINPLIKKRSKPELLWRWIAFHFFEGIRKEKIVSIRYWPHIFKQMYCLLKVDVLKSLKKLPRENIIIIRGKHDRFFCDKDDVKIAHAHNYNVIEVEAGHDWNENVAKTVTKILNKN